MATVSGVFASVEGTGSFGVALADGSTLDLGALTGAFDLSNISFESGASIDILLDGRQDLRSIAASASPYVAIWGASQPSPATFVLAGDRANRFRVEKDSTGLKLAHASGMMVILK